jgi:hypothetical protein
MPVVEDAVTWQEGGGVRVRLEVEGVHCGWPLEWAKERQGRGRKRARAKK